jgi:hypothetical protein
MAYMVSAALSARNAIDGRGVIIRGNRVREGLIEAAARERLDIKFTNPDAEHERLRRLRIYQRRDAKMAATVFVAAHNEDHPEEPAYRLWQDGDAGQAVLLEVVDLQDDVSGAFALRIEKGDEVIVAPLTREEADLLHDYNRGDTITLTAEGQVAVKEQGLQR